ncbi:MAG: insulinase family protein [Blastocatellia bacterium]|nr:insulinase family protein [Blastocatellia bacterium]
MKYFILLLLTFLLLIGSATAQTSATNSLKLPPYKKLKLDNGMTILLMEHHEVPFISFNMRIRAGSVLDPSGKEGLADITAELLRKGTKNRSSDKIASELDGVGASLFFSAQHDFSFAQSEVLKKI